MKYVERKVLKDLGLRPLPYKTLQHFIFFESKEEVLKVYQYISRETLDISDQVREWLWYNVDGHTDPWPGFPGSIPRFTPVEERIWGYDLSRMPVSDNYLHNGYLAFKDKAHASLFKLTWQ